MKDDKLIVNEIFKSIEGEGIRTGYLVTFIRLQGCNLKCSYCDTRYSCEGNEGQEMYINDILDTVSLYNVNKVTLTGGEPLIHNHVNELIDELINNNYEVNVETNGSIDISSVLRKNIIVTMDYKSISSGMNKYMRIENLNLLREQDVLKFVVGNYEDLEDMQKVLEKYKPICNIFVSPVFSKIELIDMVEYLKYNNLNNVRMQVQMHKIIWEPTKRGV